MRKKECRALPGIPKIYFLIIFWVLRTLRFGWSSCEKLRKYGK